MRKLGVMILLALLSLPRRLLTHSATAPEILGSRPSSPSMIDSSCRTLAPIFWMTGLTSPCSSLMREASKCKGTSC